MDNASQLEQVLDRAVQLATGKEAVKSRPSQRDFSRLIIESMGDARHVAVEATTGTGKSIAYLVPAAIRSALDGERTLISTETLALQSQLRDKDAPAAVRAVSEVLGLPAPKVAVLKGWSNTVCSMATIASASEITLLPSKDAKTLIGALEGVTGESADLVRWALQEVLDGENGDKASYEGVIGEDDWQLVSTTPSQCPGNSVCPFGETCLPHKAKQRAAEADIVITNHSMLAVQAATGAPVVIGSKQLGPFHHLVVDEAHGLASAVRNQGSVSINPWKIIDSMRSVERMMDRPAKAKGLRDEATALAGQLDALLVELLAKAAATAPSRSSSQVAKIASNENPFDGLDLAIQAWAGRARRMVPRPLEAHTTKEMVARYRTLSHLDALSADVSQAAMGDNGVARWVEKSDRPVQSFSGASVKMAPVNVAGMLRANLYERQAEENPIKTDEVSVGPDDEPDQVDVVVTAFEMSVSVLSATLPTSFIVDLGIDARKIEYPSPFEDAYKESWLFIPKASRSELSRAGASRIAFDVERHPEWAAGVICDLVNANKGSALVLAATTRAGKLYVEQLRRSNPKIKVHSQWDGPPLRQLIAAWRDDHSSVMVGTKSLMTGVDAPGTTCSLVIVDRCPRSASNPVDDARVENLCTRLQIGRWEADRMVYVADAALLLEQAAGRLIRSASDRGMVAVLDPRLLPSRLGDFHYPEPTRKAYLTALEHFPNRTSGMDKAIVYLHGQQRSRRAA